MIAYDIDGTLIPKAPEELTPQQRRDYFTAQWPLYYPEGDFILITARVGSKVMRSLTEKWAIEKFASCQGVFMLEGFKNRDNIRKFKDSVIKAQQVTSYYDDDYELLSYLKHRNPNTKCYLMQRGKVITEI